MNIFSQVPAQKLDEFRVNSVQGGAPGQFVPFRAVAIGVSKYKYAVSITYKTYFTYVKNFVFEVLNEV